MKKYLFDHAFFIFHMIVSPGLVSGSYSTGNSVKSLPLITYSTPGFSMALLKVTELVFDCEVSSAAQLVMLQQLQ